jgi:hypothetical protein
MGMKMDAAGSGSIPVLGFGSSSVEFSGSIAREEVRNYLVENRK